MTARITTLGETPLPGDVLFEKAKGLRLYIQQASQGYGFTQMSIVTDSGGGSISTISVTASGVQEDARRVSSIDGYVVRPGGRSLGEAIAAAAHVIADREPGWSAAPGVWLAGRRLRNSPLRWTGIAVLVGAAMQAATRRRASSYSLLAAPEFVLRSLTLGSSGANQTDSESAHALDVQLNALNAVEGWQVSSNDLFNTLSGRRNP